MAEPPELGEADVELDLERRKYVLDVHARLDALSHYELLGVARAADAQAVRRAYFQLVRYIHPDRYFGKKLGSYRAKLETIFSRMTQAYETLSNAEPRAAYDAQLGAAAAAAPPAAAPAAPAPVDPGSAARRQAALAGLQQHLDKQREKAAQQARAAERALAVGDLVAAAQAYREAIRLAPNDAALRAAHDEVQGRLAARTHDATRRQAELEEKHGHWAEAAATWQRVLDARPDDAEARARLAAARARAGRIG